MGFFTDLKEDLNQAVTELLPEDHTEPEAAGEQEPTQEQIANLEEMLQNIDELRITEDVEEIPEETYEEEVAQETLDEADAETATLQETMENLQETMTSLQDSLEQMDADAPAQSGGLEQELRATFGAPAGEETVEDYLHEEAIRTGAEILDKSWVLDLKDMEATEETAVITTGMRVKGDILSNGSVDVLGEVLGNVQISGKLNVTGKILGNSKAKEVFADSAKITGDVISDGTIKVGDGSVIRGNIEATSAVIAGAVKGTIDVRGPVVLDATAVVLGNIRAKSMQINNGARIEGMCVLCYAEQSAAKFFENQEM